MNKDAFDLSELNDAIRMAGANWEANHTSVSLLPPDQLNLRLGLPISPDEKLGTGQAEISPLSPSVMEPQGSAAPTAYDLRNVNGKNYLSPMKNQGACSTGVVFAVLDVVEGTFRVQRRNPDLDVDLSEAHLFYCYARSEGQRCSGPGWLPQNAYDHLKADGVVDEACFPYTYGDQDCRLCGDWRDRLIKITGYQNLSGNSLAMKSWISYRGPLSACMTVYPDFMSYHNGIYRHVSGGGQMGGLLVAIIGYDDAQGCWICKNHWGPNWGESGYFRIAYGECGIGSAFVHGVEGIEETMWIKGIRISGLWADDRERNAFAYFVELGWRKICGDSDSIFNDMLIQLIMAKSLNRPVTFYEEKGVIKQVLS